MLGFGPRLVWYESDGSDYEVYGGYRGGLFVPEATVKRAQFAKMIVGALGIPVNEGWWRRSTTWAPTT